MRIGVPRESRARETRVAATPATVAQLVALGYEVVVETGAGAGSSFPDEDYTAAGARIAPAEDAWASDVVLKVNAPSADELGLLGGGDDADQRAGPGAAPGAGGGAGAAADHRAGGGRGAAHLPGPVDGRAVSSMANIAGYRAVIEAAHTFGRFFTGQVTAAGKVPPAKVLVAGAGVAGLAAIGSASSLGAIVRATDVRPEVAEQVRSLGGEYVAVPAGEAEVSSDGYAREMGEDFNRRAAVMYAEQVPDVDIVITTALIPGRPAPRLITEEMVASMKSGSVIVDMAAGQGGNVAGSVADELVVTDNGVSIIGYTDLAGRLPAQASQLYGTNLVNLLKLLTPGKDGVLVLDLDDVVQRAITVVRERRDAVAPAAGPGLGRAGPGRVGRAGRTRRRRRNRRHPARRFALVGIAAAAAVPDHRVLPQRADPAPHRVRPRRGRRLLRDRARAPRAAHPADVGDQRDLRDHRGRRAAADRARRRRGHRARRSSRSCWPASTCSVASPSPAGCWACSPAARPKAAR